MKNSLERFDVQMAFLKDREKKHDGKKCEDLLFTRGEKESYICNGQWIVKIPNCVCFVQDCEHYARTITLEACERFFEDAYQVKEAYKTGITRKHPSNPTMELVEFGIQDTAEKLYINKKYLDLIDINDGTQPITYRANNRKDMLRICIGGSQVFGIVSPVNVNTWD